MPQWLVDALRTQELSEDAKSTVANKVVKAGEAHSEQAARVEPTEQDLQKRYNM